MNTRTSHRSRREIESVQLTQSIHDRLERLATSRHATLLDDAEIPIPPGDPESIVSAVPAVRLVHGRRIYEGRRQRFRFGRGGSHATMLARHRALPVDSAGSDRIVRWATNRHGRRVPVACADRATRSIHVLVDLSSACVVGREGSLDPADLLVGELFERPLGFLLDGRDEPTVGPRVREAVRLLLSGRTDLLYDLARGELSVLQRLAATGRLPRALVRKLDTLKRTTERRAERETSKPVDPRRVDREISRLRHLVSRRACSALRFTDSDIVGLMNPRRFKDGWTLRPMMFRFRPNRCRGRPFLTFWNPSRSEPRDGNGVCLGEGIFILREIESGGDVYGLVDGVLNFVETNLVGAIPPNGRRRRRLLPELIEAWF
jgi:hypothetical protein